MRFLYLITLIAILAITASFVLIPAEENLIEENICTRNDDAHRNNLPEGYNELFAGSGECLMCHNSQVNAQGESVSIIADWRSTMMANAARDPFWRAKVSHESLVNPAHAEVLEDVCTRCHAPLGNLNAHHIGQSLYSIAEMKNDSLALDGVSCTLCHQIKQESLGNFSGEMQIGTDKKIWGPYENSFANPMVNHTGYTPEYGQQIFESGLCASCHTLITNTVDLNGTPTGTEFVEQAVYQEWLNSSFSDNDISCQSCHVPRINDAVVISNMPPWLEGRSPFGQHHLAGANVFMLKILKENINELGVTATDVQLDSTIARANRMLQKKSLEVTLYEHSRTEDTLFIDLALQNLSGHKFPTAYPSRRAFVELVVTTASNDTVFHSGKMNSDYSLIGEDDEYELHHNVINEESQVQIYELVMGNVNYEPTTILEQAFIQLKDNRLPPLGFTTYHQSYDTVEIVGEALIDQDFNKLNQVEGSGKDIVHYHIPIIGINEALTVKTIIHYQTVTEKWLEDMFSYSSDDIDSFKQMYYNSDREPVLVSEESLVSLPVSINNNFSTEPTIYPNPAGKYVYINNEQPPVSASLYNINGKELARYLTIEKVNDKTCKISLPDKYGIYFLKLYYNGGQSYTAKIFVNGNSQF